MRITRLVLDRYGHLADVVLTFPPDAGLHVVLGANEAGKSTALAAIGDALFGFPHITPYAFLHATRDLRVGIGLRLDNGQERTVFRTKRNRNDLCDAGGAPVPEAELVAWLGGVSRERFARAFGLDAAALRAGGQAILEGRGDLGESILQAHTGLSGFRALADRLGEEAGRLFGTRHGRKAFHEAVDAFKTARAELDARAIAPADFGRTRDDRDRLLAERDAAAAETRALQAERARLARIRATAAARAALARDLPALAALGAVPPLPGDAATQFRDALAAREGAARDLQRERDQAAALRAEAETLAIDAALLAEGEAIDRLAADRTRIESTERDCEAQRIVATQAERALREAARRLGRDEAPEALLARSPDALAREAVARAVSAHDKLTTRRQDATDGMDAAARHLADAAARAAALPEPPPFAELRAAILAARAEGRLDSETDDAAQALVAARATLATALAALPLWRGTAEALAAAPFPLESRIAAAAEALRTARDTHRARAEALARRDEALAGLDADLKGLLAAGEPPTAEAIAAARARRDRAWHLLRRQLEGGAAPGEDDASPAGFEALLRAADTLADRRATEMQRVAAFDLARGRQAQERALREQDAAAVAAAAATLGAAQADWMALWQPVGIVVPLDPDAMREWLRQRQDVLGRRAAAQDAERRHDSLARRLAAARAALAPLLPGDMAAGPRLADLLAAAERVCAEREAAHAARAAALKDLAAAQAEAGRQQAQAGKVETELAAWREAWGPRAASLGLAADAPVESVTLALDLWAQIDLRAQQWRAALDRIEQMTGAMNTDTATVAALLGRVAPGLSATGPHAAVRTLAARLAEARRAAARRDELTQLGARAAERIAALEAQHRAAEATLAALRGFAGVADDAGLQDAIRRAADHAELTRRVGEREAELRALGDGRALAELEAEAAGTDPGLLPARLDEIAARLDVLGAENDARTAELTRLRARLDEMERGRDATESAQAMRDALAEAGEVATRYVRVRLAQTLLSAGIEHFRRQSQGPLLHRAGALFAALTEGRYARLDVDTTEKGEPLVAALRADGSACPVERLSDGTRDQLYLALRLAAIEADAAGGECLPLIADDLLVNFDDRRAQAALRVLAAFGARTQTILFTHHAHIAAMAADGIAPVQHLPPEAEAPSRARLHESGMTITAP